MYLNFIIYVIFIKIYSFNNFYVRACTSKMWKMLKTYFSNSFQKNTLQQGCCTQNFWQLSYSRLPYMTVDCGSTLKKEKKILLLSHYSLSFLLSFFSYRSHFILSFLLSPTFLSLSFFTPRGKPHDFKVGSEQNQKKGSEIERMAGARG